MSADNRVICTRPQQAGIAIGIVKSNYDPGRQRLSADNRVICARPQQAGIAIGIVKWNFDPDWLRLSADNGLICTRVSAGPNCYRYREMKIPPLTSSIVG